MNALFGRVFLDEDVDVLVADLRGPSRGVSCAGRRHSGIFIAVRRPPHLMLANLLELLNRLTADELRGQLLYV